MRLDSRKSIAYSIGNGKRVKAIIICGDVSVLSWRRRQRHYPTRLRRLAARDRCLGFVLGARVGGSKTRKGAYSMLLYRTSAGLLLNDRPGGPLVSLPNGAWDDVFT